MKTSTWNGRLEGDDLLRDMAWLRRLARSLVGDAADGDDLAQETWTKLLAKQRRPLALRPYLAGIARKLLLEKRRKESRRADHETHYAAMDFDALERLDLHEHVIAALRGLPESQRAVVVLRYFDDLDSKEIAARLELPAATVRSQLSRGLASLRERLDETTEGGRQAWLSALVPLAASSLPTPLTLGPLVLTMKTLLTLTGLILALAVTLLNLPFGSEPLARDTLADLEQLVAGPVVQPAESFVARLGLDEPTTPPARRIVDPAGADVVFGVVVTRAGNPVPNADVRLLALPGQLTTTQIYAGEVPPSAFENQAEARDRGTTETAGTFRLDAGPAAFGTLVLVAKAAGFPTAVLCLATRPAGAVRFVIDAPPMAGTLRGQVVDQDGVPIEDFLVVLEVPEGARPTGGAAGQVGSGTLAQAKYEAAAGAFELDVPMIVRAWDRFRLRVTAPGFSGDRLELVTATFPGTQDGVLEVRLELHAGRVLRGRVVDPSGAPIGGAEVRVIERVRRAKDGDNQTYSTVLEFGESRRSGPDGRFQVAVLRPLGFSEGGLEVGAEFFSLRIEAPGYSRHTLLAADLDLDAGEVRIELTPGARLAGHVEAKEHLGGLAVIAAAHSLLGSGSADGGWVARVPVAEDGSYRFEGVPSGVVFVTLVRGGDVETTEVSLELAAGESRTLDLFADEWGALRGTFWVLGTERFSTTGVASEDLAITVSLCVPSSSPGEAPRAVATWQGPNGQAFRLPSLGTAPAGSCLRVSINEFLHYELAVDGLGADLDLGLVEVDLAEFESSYVAPSGMPLPR